MVRISDAEFEVMKVIWARKETTSLEIIDDLKDFKWNFNTIRTLIKRLQLKGAIEVTGRNGKAYSYRAIIDENKYKTEIARDLVKKLYNGSTRDFVREYCMNNKVTSEDLKEVMKYVEKKEAREGKTKEVENEKK